MLKKADLVNIMADEVGLTKKQAAEALEAFLSAVEKSLANGEEVLITKFGKFEVRERAARKGINPQTKEPITLPATKVAAFKAGKALKDAVKG
jgi:DNA-binding protein HU-beta